MSAAMFSPSSLSPRPQKPNVRSSPSSSSTTSATLPSARLSVLSSSSGGVDVDSISATEVVTRVAFFGPYGRIGTILQRPPGPPSSPAPRLRRVPGFAAHLALRCSPPSPFPPLPPSAPTLPQVQDGQFGPLPANMETSRSYGWQFVRGIAGMRNARTEVDELDSVVLNATALGEEPSAFRVGRPEAVRARFALDEAQRDLSEAMAEAIQEVNENKNAAMQLEVIREQARRLQPRMHGREQDILDLMRQPPDMQLEEDREVAHYHCSQDAYHRLMAMWVSAQTTMADLRIQVANQAAIIEELEDEKAEFYGYA